MEWQKIEKKQRCCFFEGASNRVVAKAQQYPPAGSPIVGQDPINGVDPTGTRCVGAGKCGDDAGQSVLATTADNVEAMYEQQNAALAARALNGVANKSSSRPRPTNRRANNSNGNVRVRIRLNLRQHEGGPLHSHTIRDHVGRSNLQLQQRAIRLQQNYVSTFNNLQQANTSFRAAVRGNPGILRELAAQGNGRREIQYRMPMNVGRVYNHSTGKVSQSNHVRFVLQAVTPPGGNTTIRVVTGYTLPRVPPNAR